MQIRMLFNAVVAAGLALPITATAKYCELRKKAEAPLGYSNGLVTVEAKINGAPVVLGIDTGAQTFVSPETAAGLKLVRDWRRTLARGTTAVVVANHVIIRDFEFGGDHFTWKSVPKIALPQQKTSLQPNIKPVAGLVGMDVLGDYDLDLDFEHRKLTLYNAKGCSEISPSGFTSIKSVPFRFNEQRNILIPVELDGARLTALFDTGATLHMITRSGARKAGVTEAALKSDPSFEATGAGNVSQKHALHKFNKLAVAGITLSNVPAGVLNRPLWQGEFLLGQPFWIRRRLWISSATRTLYFDDPPLQFGRGTLGADLKPAAPAGPQKVPTLAEACLTDSELRMAGACETKPARPFYGSSPGDAVGISRFVSPPLANEPLSFGR